MRCARNCVRLSLCAVIVLATVAIVAPAQPQPKNNAATIAALDRKLSALSSAGKYTQALALQIRAANLGSAIDQFRLCESYNLGAQFNPAVTTPDHIQAMFWCMKADAQGGYNPANWGHYHPTSYIGWLYELGGYGLPQDLAQARTWYQKAVKEGDYRAANTLGQMYATGRGGPQDLAQARVWFQIAANAGFPPAVNALARLNSQPYAQPAPAPQQSAPQQGHGACAAVYLTDTDDTTYGMHWFYGAAWSRATLNDAESAAQAELMQVAAGIDPRALPGGQYAPSPAPGSGCNYAHGAVAGKLKIAPGGGSIWNPGGAPGKSPLGPGIYDTITANFADSTDAAVSAAMSQCQSTKTSGDYFDETCTVLQQW